MKFDWSIEKNTLLKTERAISFERIIIAIEEDKLLDILEHPNKEKYPNQFLLIVEISEYVYVVPCVIEKDVCFAGEVGLGGEIRPVQRVEQRITEAEKLGFNTIFISKYNKIALKNTKIKIVKVAKIEDAIGELFG